MLVASAQNPGHWVADLRRFLGSGQPAPERCELCSEAIDPQHQHLIEPATRQLLCACTPCSLLFSSPDARRYRRVPRDAHRLPGFELSDGQWEAFQIPINLAFFFHSSPQACVLAMYPGPAGATESTLNGDEWEDLVAANPALATMEADVEALLVNRVDGAREVYRVPIDRCYELVGRIRSNWHGLSGGEGVRATIGDFFQQLREQTGN